MQEPDWDDLRIFLAVLRGGSIIAAARYTGLDHSTVTRRITKLEERIGQILLHRSPAGVTPTEAGSLLAQHAERIAEEIAAARTLLDAREEQVSGTVRLATPEAFGLFLVAPAVEQLYRRHPNLQLELMPESRSVSLSRREADMAVVLTQPPRGQLVARRLVDYRLGLYASQDYLDRTEALTDIAALRGHPLVWYIDEMIDLPELRFLDQIAGGSSSVFRSSSIAAQQAAVAGGLGYGVLHAFSADGDPRLRRVLADAVEVKRSYWLIFPRQAQRVPRVRAVAEFLSALIQQKRALF
jgi:DNA-binding transcriptional LysR family regulator